MATLISPGVSVTVTDESFFIPAQAPTIPLLFIATADEKTQADGVTPALGTYESNVIRTITSLTQSTQLYGIPTFLTDVNGNQLNGDCRNEYGLLALNQCLAVGVDSAFVIRAFVNLNDTRNNILSLWAQKIAEAANLLTTLCQATIANYNAENGYFVGNPNFKTTVTKTEFLDNAHAAMTEDVYVSYSFRNTGPDFEDDHTATPFDIFPNGYDQPPAPNGYLGLAGIADQWVTLGLGSVVSTEWTPQEAADTLIAAGGDFQYTVQFLNETSLGANDAARRNAIVTALRQTIVSNQDIRSDQYLYNVIVCPGYSEVVQQLISLNIQKEDNDCQICDGIFVTE